MRLNCAAALALFVLPGCSVDTKPSAGAALLIKDVVVISAQNPAVSGPVNVLVRDGRIVAVGASAAESAGDSLTLLDGAGRFLIPGLIDGHTHLGEIPGMSFEQEARYPGIASRARRQIPRSYLYHGFTTVVDLNSRPRAIRDWNAEIVRPQAYFCGASPVFDGYPMSFMPKPARYGMMPYFLYDESRSEEFPGGIDPRSHTPSVVVDRIHADGGICVKTHFERGFGGRGNLPVPDAELVKALVDAAHDKGLPVLLHANSEAAQSFGNGTGVDAFAHGMWTWDDASTTGLTANITDIVDAAIANEIALQPTVQVLYGEQDIHNPDYLSDPRLREVLPDVLIDWYRTDDGQWWRKRMLGIPAVSRLVDEGRWAELDAAPIARVSTVLGYFVENGGRLLFGSDTPSDPTFANPPGLNGRIEMDNWIAAGVSHAQLFRAATLGNATFFGLGDEIGTVEVGKRADLLLLRANPLSSVSAYDTIDYVILAGKVIERTSLSALSAPPQSGY